MSSSVKSSSSSSGVKRYKYTSISRALINKLKKIREKIKEDNDIYISKEHKEICYHYKKFKEYEAKQKKERTLVKFDYNFDEINLLDIDEDDIIDQFFYFIELPSITPNSDKFDYYLFFNKYNEKFINNLDKFVITEHIQKFLTAQSNYIFSLSPRDIFNLKHYPDEGYKIVCDFIDNSFSPLVLDIKYESYSTLFICQFLDYFKSNPVYINRDGIRINVNTAIKRLFFNFIKANYKDFSMDIYNYVINKYISEINNVIKNAPKNQDVIYLYKAVEDNYITKELSLPANRSKKFFTSDRFMTTNLLPEIAIQQLEEPNRYLYEIKINKNVPVLFIGGISIIPNKMTVLLPIKSKLYIDYAHKKVKYHKNKELICYDKANKDSFEISMTSLIYFLN